MLFMVLDHKLPSSLHVGSLIRDLMHWTVEQRKRQCPLGSPLGQCTGTMHSTVEHHWCPKTVS